MHAHHVVPVSAGGSDHWRNLVILCPNHHAVAHTLWPVSGSGDYEGPRTPGDLVVLLREFERDPVGYYEAMVQCAFKDAEREIAAGNVEWARPEPRHADDP